MNKQTFSILLFLILFQTTALSQNLEQKIKNLFTSLDRSAEKISVSESNIGTIVEIIYSAPVKNISEAENMYYDSIIRTTRTTMGNAYYPIFKDYRNLNSVSITAVDSLGNNIIKTVLTGEAANRYNWQALKRILVEAFPERWSTSIFSLKNEVWFNVPESVIQKEFY